MDNEFKIFGQDFGAQEKGPDSDRPPEMRYRLDLDRTNVLGDEPRTTISGVEKTVIAMVPPKGCQYDCDFCGVKDLRNPDFPVQGEDGERAARVAVDELEEILKAAPDTETLKIFNSGNIAYGSERGRSAEMNEAFWPALIEMLGSHPEVHAVELEVRIDEFVGAAENPGNGAKTSKGILRDRLLSFDRGLKLIGKRLRLILPFEYIESDIIKDQAKFPPVFTNEGKSRENSEQAIAFAKEHDIEYLSYAMLGGRLSERSLEPDEAVASAAHTVLFALARGAREAVINSQYLTPREQWEAKRDGVPYYVPNENDMRRTLAIIVSGLEKMSPEKEKEARPRVRLTTDKEDIIEGTSGPEISRAFRELVLEFNNAPDQIAFFKERMQN